MIRSFSLTLVSASVVALLAVACGSSDSGDADKSTGPTSDSGAAQTEDGGKVVDSGVVPQSNAFTLEYLGSCTPSACSGSPSGGADGIASCTTSSDGSCGWNPGAPGSTNDADSGDDTTASYAPCDQSECPAAPAIDCAPGYDKSSPQCGKLNGGACQTTIVCTAHDSGKACAVANGCGDTMTDIGIVCDGGGSGSFACNQTVAGCKWEPECP